LVDDDRGAARLANYSRSLKNRSHSFVLGANMVEHPL